MPRPRLVPNFKLNLKLKLGLEPELVLMSVSSETTSEGALSGTLKVRSGTISFDWALQADRLTCGDEMESYISENGESRGRQAELTSWLNISWGCPICD